MEGWVKIHRKMLDNPIVCKDSDHVFVWMHMLLKATHTPYSVMFGGQRITMQPGQFISGRLKIAQETGVNESKVKRIINAFKSDQQIDQQTSNKCSLFTIKNWDLYQVSDQQDAQQVTSKWTASDQQVTTNKNIKNVEKVKNGINNNTTSAEYPYEAVVDYLNERTGKQFKDKSKDTRRLIKARVDEGFNLEDFKKVIDNKVADWGKPMQGEKDMREYLRPATLFGQKFESYLNSAGTLKTGGSKNKFNNFDQRDNDVSAIEKILFKKMHEGDNRGGN